MQPGYPQTVILSLSHGFMSHGFIGKKVADGQFLVADGPFFAAGLFLTYFFQTYDHNILTCDQLKFTYFDM